MTDAVDAAAGVFGLRRNGGVQVIMATWVEGKGWLTTRTGVAICGPGPFPVDEEAMMIAARGAYRAIKHRLMEERDA